MKVYDSVLMGIDNEIRIYSSEIGGILGSCDGEIVSEYLIDKPDLKSLSYCCYSPNVDFLNSAIKKWQDKDIYFMGIFHTHFSNSRTLSVADKCFIHEIMYAMPSVINRLYFPIYVLPTGNMECYLAEKSEHDVIIKSDPIVII